MCSHFQSLAMIFITTPNITFYIYTILDQTWNYAEIYKFTQGAQGISPLESGSSSSLATDAGNQPDTRDILDLQRIADDMAEDKRDKSSRHIDGKLCIPFLGPKYWLLM